MIELPLYGLVRPALTTGRNNAQAGHADTDRFMRSAFIITLISFTQLPEWCT